MCLSPFFFSLLRVNLSLLENKELTYITRQYKWVCGGQSAYLWDLKEYCMCPQELKGLRQSREKKGREEREKEMQSAKTQVRDHLPFEN